MVHHAPSTGTDALTTGRAPVRSTRRRFDCEPSGASRTQAVEALPKAMTGVVPTCAGSEA